MAAVVDGGWGGFVGASETGLFSSWLERGRAIIQICPKAWILGDTNAWVQGTD